MSKRKLPQRRCQPANDIISTADNRSTPVNYAWLLSDWQDIIIDEQQGQIIASKSLVT